MKTLFEQTAIKGLILENRLVRSATWEGMCDDDGRPTRKLIDCYRDLAAGGVGLIISGFAFVRPDGKQMPGKMGLHTDEFADEMKALTGAVHDNGGKICAQLVHAGGQATAASAGRQPLAPSALKVDQFTEEPAEMSVRDISEIVAAFGQAARRAKEFGFDAVELHGAHGYLINQFLSPLTNRRKDDYGGRMENRMRFALEVIASVRAEVGEDYPVFIKLNVSDNLEAGFCTKGGVFAARVLSEAGIDMIEVSGGTPASGDEGPARTKIDTLAKEGYNLALAEAIKEAVTCPLMLVGGIRSFELAESLIAQGAVDYISMSRPFIREPALANRWCEGDHARATCISCNGCFKPGLQEGGIYCVVDKKE